MRLMGGRVNTVTCCSGCGATMGADVANPGVGDPGLSSLGESEREMAGVCCSGDSCSELNVIVTPTSAIVFMPCCEGRQSRVN